MNRCFEIFEFSVSIALTRRLNVFCPTGTRNLIQITGPSLTIAGKKSRPFRSRCRASRTSPRASWFSFWGSLACSHNKKASAMLIGQQTGRHVALGQKLQFTLVAVKLFQALWKYKLPLIR